MAVSRLRCITSRAEEVVGGPRWAESIKIFENERSGGVALCLLGGLRFRIDRVFNARQDEGQESLDRSLGICIEKRDVW